MLVGRLRFLRRAKLTLGSVVGRKVERSGNGTSSVRITVGYPTADGGTYTLEQAVERDRKVGDRVEVLYDPADPERAYVRFGVAYIVVMTAITVVIGLLFGWFAIMMFSSI